MNIGCIQDTTTNSNTGSNIKNITNINCKTITNNNTNTNTKANEYTITNTHTDTKTNTHYNVTPSSITYINECRLYIGYYY